MSFLLLFPNIFSRNFAFKSISMKFQMFLYINFGNLMFKRIGKGGGITEIYYFRKTSRNMFTYLSQPLTAFLHFLNSSIFLSVDSINVCRMKSIKYTEPSTDRTVWYSNNLKFDPKIRRKFSFNLESRPKQT